MIEYKLKKGNILKDGHTMFLQDVVKDLNRKAYLEDLKSKTDAGAKLACSDGLDALAIKEQLDKLLNKVNAVTCPYRHGQKVTDRVLTELSNRQIDVEKALRDMGL